MHKHRKPLSLLLLLAIGLASVTPEAPGGLAPAFAADQTGTHFFDHETGIAFDVPKGINLYTKSNRGPLGSQIDANAPFILVNPTFTEENVNVKLVRGATASDLSAMKSQLDRSASFGVPGYKRVSVSMITIGKSKDIPAVEHVFFMKGNIPGKVRSVAFVLNGNGFIFTCATGVDRFECQPIEISSTRCYAA